MKFKTMGVYLKQTDLMMVYIRSTQFLIRNSISVNNPLKNDVLWKKGI